MVDLRARFLGLELDSPLLASASPLSRSLDSARRLEDGGAGAIVMYSLFEDELRDAAEAAGQSSESAEFRRGLDHYLEHLHRLKAQLRIPVIASLNGASLDGWICHGRALEDAGADALELNVLYMPTEVSESAEQIETRYLELLRELHAAVSIPICMKISAQFTSVPNMVKCMEEEGAQGVALFNRYYQPDIDLDSLRLVHRLQLSQSYDALLPLRWIALLYRQVGLDLAASGGVHTVQDVLKLLLAGADVVYLCSALLRHGPEWLGALRAQLAQWMEASGYESLRELRGRVVPADTEGRAGLAKALYVATPQSDPDPRLRRC